MSFEIIYLYDTQPGVALEKNVYLTMRDGIKLAMDVYKPAKGKGPWPVILGMAPYPKEALFETANPGFFTANGYVVVNLVVRGSGLSEGQYDFFSETENQDGYDIVEGIAKMPWCNGKVGMFGASYLGMNQWHTAALKPPHLKCIVPYAATADLYRDSHYIGGVNNFGFLTMWWNTNCKRFIWPAPDYCSTKKLPPVDYAAEGYLHPVDGPYYWQISGYTKVSKIEIPVYSITPGHQMHSLSQLHAWPDIKSIKKLMVVPPYGLSPSFYGGNLGMLKQLIRWYDQWMKDIDTGIVNEPEVAIFDNGTATWRYENEYPIARTNWTKFYLHHNPASSAKNQPWGLLTKEVPQSTEKPDNFAVVPEGHFSQIKPEFIGYATEPLKEDLTIKGPVSVTVFGSAETKHTCTWAWFVKIGDIAPDGKLTELVYGNLKACFRELDQRKSKPGQPWHPFQNPVYLEPNKVYEFQIEVQPLFQTFKAGHQIFIRISGQEPGFRNESTFDPVIMGEGPIPARISVYHDSEHPSYVNLPVIPDAPEVAPVKQPVEDIRLDGPAINGPYMKFPFAH